MAIDGVVEIVESALWQQGDARDPLGIWGARAAITGDLTGGLISMTFQVAAAKKAAYVYSIYSANHTHLTGAAQAYSVQFRILSNWPNVDPQAGVQAYATAIIRTTANVQFTVGPASSIEDGPLVSTLDRFILIYDPRPIGAVMDIATMQIGTNVNTDTYGFEIYGYYWDRAVMAAPGGPRHPGSN